MYLYYRIENPSECEYLLMPVGVQPGGVAILQTSNGQFVYYLVSYEHHDHIYMYRSLQYCSEIYLQYMNYSYNYFIDQKCYIEYIISLTL